VVEEPDPDGPTHHREDGGSVRIVSPSSAVALTPVDPDAFVAEVAALRAGVSAGASPPSADVPSTEGDPTPIGGDSSEPEVVEAPPPVPEDAPVASDSSPPDEAPTRSVTSSDAIDPQPAMPAPVANESDVVDVVTPVDRVAAVPSVEDDRGADEVEEIPADATADLPVDEGSDEIGSLFAQLRGGPAPSPEVHADPGTVDEPAPVHHDPPPAAASSDRVEVAETGDTPGDPERGEPTTPSWIPMQNEALRTIKRSLVELQNETLEHLRTDAAWVPDEAFVDRFTPAFVELAGAIGGEPDDLGTAFATDLLDAVSSAIERTRGAGAGDREVAAAASKVFRMWRSDEAERRVFGATATTSLA
jgi:hypothetical protein